MSKSPFYVGYLSVPPSIRRHYLLLTPLIIPSGLGVGFLLANSQQSAGNGVWSPSEPITLRGIVTTNPYAVIHTSDGDAALLVMVGKRGTVPIARPYAGTFVQITGNPIRRGGMIVLEHAGPEAIIPATVPAVEVGTAVEPAGEIVDTKCFLGVMKPARARFTARAQPLCLKGGMPLMLVTQSDAGATGYLLVSSADEAMSGPLTESAGVPLRISGTVETRGPGLTTAATEVCDHHCPEQHHGTRPYNQNDPIQEQSLHGHPEKPW